MQTRTDRACRAFNKGFHMAVKIHGRGWASWDWGKETLRKQAWACHTRGGITAWKFEYYERDGNNEDWEWWSTFTIPKAGSVNRCWNNLKFQRVAGGYTHNMRKHYEDERYEEWGYSLDDGFD